MDINLLGDLILKPLFLALMLAFMLTPPTIWLAKKFKLVTDVTKRKHPAHTHQGIIPRAGGLPIFLAVIVCCFLFLPLDQHLKGILGGISLLTFVGLLDDRFDLNPYLRIGTCLIAAIFVITSGIGISFINNPFGGKIINLNKYQISFFLLGKQHHISPLADLLALVWIIWMTNTVNWVKGFDGQLPGIVTISALTIALLSLRFSADITQWPVAILASITAGAYLGFLPFNFYPQRIMPGYGGGSLAGFLLAVLAILSTTKLGTAIVVLGVPIIDAIFVITRRLLSGHSPVWADRGHLHHLLLDLGWGKRKTAYFYWAVTATLGACALYLNSQQKLYTIVMLTIILGGLLLWLHYFRHLSDPQDQDNL
ncbi:glycosyltransferase family 4 protein [Patescibacteria group bacterium]